MPTFYKIDKERRLILSSGSGTFSLADAMGHQKKLPADLDFDPSFSQIADFRHVTQFDISVNDVQKLAEKSIFSAESRRAFIMPNEVGFGLARMFEILRANVGEEKIGVFRDLEAALDWILSKNDDS